MMNGLVRRSWIFFPGLALVLAAPVYAETVTLTPSLAFGNQAEGTTSLPQTATLKNGSTTAITITSIAVTGDYAQAGGTCPKSPNKLAAGASCAIPVTFTPKALGLLSGKLTVTDTAGNSPQTASLSGTGTAPITLSPTSLNFGQLPLGETSQPKAVTLTNNQNVALNFTSVLTSGDFAVASNTCVKSIAAGTSCTVNVTFTPTEAGARTGQLTFTDTAFNSPQVVSLAGTGTGPVLISIAVTPANSALFLNAVQQFTATGTYSNQTTKNLSTTVTWTTTPTGIVSINTSGLATCLAVGRAEVTATLSPISGSTSLSVSQAFFPTGSLNTARYYHSATLLDTGYVLLAGGIGPVPGETGALGELASAEVYSPAAGNFEFTGYLNTARDQQSATVLNNGSVLIAGGASFEGELSSAEIYTPSAGSFANTGSLHTARYEHTATMLPDGTVLIAGGVDGDTVLATAEIYSPATGQFAYTTGSLNDARFSATATLLPNGMVLIAGGADATGALSSAELYAPATGMFTPTTYSLNVARSGATATLLDTGNVLIANGYNYLATGPLTTAELYDPVTGMFTMTGSLASSAWLGTATLLGDGNVMVAGSSQNSAYAEVFNPATGIFALSGPLITARDLQSATLLPNGQVLLAGGHSNVGNSVLAAAELYEPTTLAPPNLVSIAITPANPSLTVGGSLQLVATGTFSDSSTQVLQSLDWGSTNPPAATVTNDQTNSGATYGAAIGNTIISACAGTICGRTPLTVVTGATDRR